MVVDVDGRADREIGRDKDDTAGDRECGGVKPRRKSNNLIAFATVMFCDDSARDDRWWRMERSICFHWSRYLSRARPERSLCK